MLMKYRLVWNWTGGLKDPPSDIQEPCQNAFLEAYNFWAKNSDSVIKAANDFCSREYGTTDANDPRVKQKHCELWNEELRKLFSSLNHEQVEFFIDDELNFTAMFPSFEGLRWHYILTFTLERSE